MDCVYPYSAHKAQLQDSMVQEHPWNPTLKTSLWRDKSGLFTGAKSFIFRQSSTFEELYTGKVDEVCAFCGSAMYRLAMDDLFRVPCCFKCLVYGTSRLFLPMKLAWWNMPHLQSHREILFRQMPLRSFHRSIFTYFHGSGPVADHRLRLGLLHLRDQWEGRNQRKRSMVIITVILY